MRLIPRVGVALGFVHVVPSFCEVSLVNFDCLLFFA